VGPDGVARAAWNPSEEFKSYADRVHGGVIATLMDSAMVHALFARDVAGVTAELVIRYHHEVAFRESVHVTGWVESSRRGVFYCRAEVRQMDRLAAHATAKFMRMAVAAQA
jgi:acyl-coenzyme A thioesterase PaaI-like protein